MIAILSKLRSKRVRGGNSSPPLENRVRIRDSFHFFLSFRYILYGAHGTSPAKIDESSGFSASFQKLGNSGFFFANFVFFFFFFFFLTSFEGIVRILIDFNAIFLRVVFWNGTIRGEFLRLM